MLRRKSDIRRLEPNHIPIGLLLHQRIQNGAQFLRGAGVFHQHDLKQAVVQLDILFFQSPEAPHGDRVGHHAVDKVSLQSLPVMGHLHMAGLQLGQAFDPPQHIGQVAQDILGILGSGIAHLREHAEGGHIDEGPAVELPQITGAGTPLHRNLSRAHQIGRQFEGLGKIIGGSRREIAQSGHCLRVGQQAGDHLIQGAVPSAADHMVVLTPQLRSGLGGISPEQGGMDCDRVARGGEQIDHVVQPLDNALFARVGIVDKQQAFQKKPPISMDQFLRVDLYIESIILSSGRKNNHHFGNFLHLPCPSGVAVGKMSAIITLLHPFK